MNFITPDADLHYIQCFDTPAPNTNFFIKNIASRFKIL